MATKYLSKDGWHFQYIVNDAKPFYTALVTNQGATASATAIVEEDGERLGEIKPIFPGGDIVADDPLY